VRGELDHRRLRAALDQLVRRHDVLRSSIVQQHDLRRDDPSSWWTAYRLAEVAGPVEIDVALHDDPASLDRLRPIDLASPPLARLDCAPLGSDHLLRLTTLHAVSDGYSVNRFWHELSLLHEDVALPPPAMTYAAYLDRERDDWRSGAWDPSIRYWRDQLAGLDASPFPPSSRKLSIWPLRKKAKFEFVGADLDAFRRLQRSLRLTPFIAAVGLFALGLRDVFRWPEAVLVMPVANRDADTHQMLGMFVNLTILRFPIDGDAASVLHGARTALLGALTHGHVPLFLLGTLVPEMAAWMADAPHVSVRQPDPRHVRSTDEPGSDGFLPADEAQYATPANDYGFGVDLLADVVLERDRVEIHLTYRADKLHADDVHDVIAACRSHLSASSDGADRPDGGSGLG
jgi:hypothetical protein